MNKIYNEWTFSGEIFYLKELGGEFAASLKLRGVSRRENAMSSQITEIACLMEKNLYEQFKQEGHKIYTNITMSGHIESWARDKETKTMLIADFIVDE